MPSFCSWGAEDGPLVLLLLFLEAPAEDAAADAAEEEDCC